MMITDTMKNTIFSILRLHTKNNLDFPFIAYFRKSVYSFEFSVDEFWLVAELFQEWMLLMSKKMKIINDLNALRESLDNDNQVSYNILRLNEISSFDDLHYFEEFLIFCNEVYIKGQKDSFANQGSVYKILQCARFFGLDKFSKEFILPQVDLERNLELLINNFNNFEGANEANETNDLKPPTNPKIKPAQMAFDYVKEELNEEIKILTFTCKFIAIQLSCYPRINKIFKEYLYENATLTTTPTEEGAKELDIMHPSFRVKRITKKKLNTFQDDLFTDIALCEKSNLINVKVELEPDQELHLKNIFRKAFLNNKIDKKNVLNNEWNTVREEALRMMIDECLMPKQIANIKRFLKLKAEEVVIEKCREEFKKLIYTKPMSNGIENKSNLISFIYDKSKNIVSLPN